MEQRIILYSTDCPRCKLVKQMLDVHNIPYTEIVNKQVILDKDFDSVPMMDVDGKIMDYSGILTWLEQNNYYSLEEN